MTPSACPVCGSGAIDASPLVGGTARCRICGWTGKREDLLAVMQKVESSDEQMAMALRADLREVVGHLAPSILKVLAKWQFLELHEVNGKAQVREPKHAVRYLNAIGQALFVAIVEERQKIEKESQPDGPAN